MDRRKALGTVLIMAWHTELGWWGRSALIALCAGQGFIMYKMCRLSETKI